MEQSSTPWRVFDAPATTGGTDRDLAAPSDPSRTALNGRDLGDRRLAVAAVLGAAAIGGLALAIALSGPGVATIEGPEATVRARASGDLAVAREIVVDVAGAVVRPGVYHLATGARIGDAIEAAGGFSPRVDVDRVGREVNLAAALADGAQIRVPSRDAAGPSTGPGGGGGGGVADGDQLVDLNTATEAELDALPGIGPVTAGKIIESRAGSPFRTVDELRERGLVGEKTFEKLRPLLTVS